MSKTLWLSNLTGIDLNLSDIGVTLKANRTINIYKYNPRLTEEQVELSLSSGILGRYTKPNANNKIYCKVVKKPVPKPIVAKKVVTVVKSEMPNAVVVQNPLDYVDESGFLSVDYGFDTSLIKISDGVLTPSEELAIRSANKVQNGQKPNDAPQKTEETFMVGENTQNLTGNAGSIEAVGSGKNKAFVVKHNEPVNADVDENLYVPATIEASEERPKINVGKKPKE